MLRSFAPVLLLVAAAHGSPAPYHKDEASPGPSGPPAPPDGCNVVAGTDYKFAPGGVFPATPTWPHGLRLAHTAGACCDMCKSFKNCSFWSFEHGGTAAKPTCYQYKEACCILKTAAAAGKSAHNAGATSGSMKAVKPPAPPPPPAKIPFGFAKAFGNGMVLAAAPKQAMIWGFCDPGASVAVTLDGGAKVQATIGPDQATGTLMTWRIKLPATKASFTNHTITATSAGKTVALSGALFGEVWVCSGQSNMEYPIGSPVRVTITHTHTLSLPPSFPPSISLDLSLFVCVCVCVWGGVFVRVCVCLPPPPSLTTLDVLPQTCWNASNINCTSKHNGAQCGFGCTQDAAQTITDMAKYDSGMRLFNVRAIPQLCSEPLQNASRYYYYYSQIWSSAGGKRPRNHAPT